MDYNQLYELFSNNKVVIYANYYEKNKRYFNSFEELMNNFNIYNEPLINQLNRIKVLD